MSLKFEITVEEHEKLDEAKQGLYKKDGDNYRLDVSGAVPKSKLEEFRTYNHELENQLKAFEGLDPDKYKAMIKTQEQLDDKKLIDAGEIETLVSNKVEAATSDFQSKLDAANKRNDALAAQLADRDVKELIENSAHKAFTEHRIRPEVQDDLMKSIKSTFSVKDGKAVGMDGETILAGANGNLSINEFVEGKPDFMKIPSNGGKGGENGGSGNSGGKQLHGVAKIQAGLEKRAKQA